MTIRYVESRYKVGPIAIGTKLGAETPKKGLLFETAKARHWGIIEFPHTVRVFANGSDAILVKGVERGPCEACAPRILVRDQINSGFPWVSKKIRWVED